MNRRNIYVLIFIFFIKPLKSIILENGNVTLNMEITPDDGIIIEFSEGGTKKLSGRIGYGIHFDTFRHNSRRALADSDDVEFSITDVVNGFSIYWESPDTTQIFQDCFELNSGSTDWFTGRQGNSTWWPVQDIVIEQSEYILRDDASIAEPYWLSSNGVFLFVNETTPLLVDQNSLYEDNLCFIAKASDFYKGRERVVLNYTIGGAVNAREAHFQAVNNYLGRTSGTPDTAMVQFPVWSTWMRFKTDFNSKLLYDYAESIHANGFRGQIEIFDGWEDCYGSLAFDKHRFSDIQKTLMDIQSFALHVTLWVHPFINENCTITLQEARNNHYLVKDAAGNDITSWRNGAESHLIDFTNEDARSWFGERIATLLTSNWLDGVRFDAGEAGYAPDGAVFKGDVERAPNQLSYFYNAMANFSTSCKAKSGWRTQWVPVFVTIPDKESNWSLENGLKSVIINLMQLNLAGYTLVSPGLVGGISKERPSPELFIRWLQAVTFMPVIEFGYVPWEFYSPKFDVLAITKKFLDLHEWYTDKIKNVIKKCQSTGLPVNAPIWWIDSENPAAFKIIDQYMLGEDFLIAPILEEGAVSRDIYLPPGNWADGNDDTIKYEGNKTLKNYQAPIDVLPYFIKQKE